MPGVGDQHRSGPATTNPFEENKPRMSEYTAQEVATLQSRLEKQLGPEFISSRPGAGGQKVHYLAAEKAIQLANEVFGFNGWSSAIQNIQIDFVDENTNTGKISLGLSVIVRVTLQDGTYHEDIGYGHIENAKGKAMAFEKAKKEGTTDALKRALRNFGNVLGNCIYDKDYIAKVTKVKVGQPKFSVENLHRAPQFAPTPVAPVKKEVVEATRMESAKISPVSDDTSPTEEDDEFGVELFDEADFGESYQEVDGVAAEDKDVKMGGMTNQPNGRPPPPNAQTPLHIPPRVPPPQQQRVQSGNNGPLQTTSNAAPTVPQTPSRGQAPALQPQPHQKPQTTTATTQSRPPIITQAGLPSNAIPQAALPSNVIARSALPSNAIPQSGLPSNRSNSIPRPPTHPPPNQTRQPNSPSIGNNTRATPTTSIASHSSSPGTTSGHFNAQNPQNQSYQPPDTDMSDLNIPPATFLSARAAIEPAAGIPVAANPSLQFNPHADSPSIRKTAGFNHAKSAPIVRAALGMAPPALPPNAATASNGNTNAPMTYVDPARDTNRRVGAPPGFSVAGQGRPMSTSSFRSHVVKRGPDGNPIAGQGAHSPTNAAPMAGNGSRQYQPPNQQNQNQNSNPNIAARRPPLSDVTNAGAASPGPDLKRVKIEGTGTGDINVNGNGSFRAANGQ